MQNIELSLHRKKYEFHDFGTYRTKFSLLDCMILIAEVILQKDKTFQTRKLAIGIKR